MRHLLTVSTLFIIKGQLELMVNIKVWRLYVALFGIFLFCYINIEQTAAWDTLNYSD